jgi:hypothetical protein
MGSFSRGLEATNYLCHFGEYTRLRDFVEVGLPEYTLQRLIALSYLQKRAENVIIPAQEELLILAINSLNSKYGKARVTKLKKRLGIKELNYH